MMYAVNQHTRTARFARAGFTIIELLVVLAIISVLTGLLMVAIGGARSTAMGSTTRARMGAMVQATDRFKGDTGYLPPLLDNDRSALDGLEPTNRTSADGPAYLERMQGWYSYTSPAEYLLGYGSSLQDGHDGLGIRRPADDGYWGAQGIAGGDAVGQLIHRRPPQGTVSDSFSDPRGPVLGPYLEIDDLSMVGAFGGDASGWDGSIDSSTGQPRVYMAGDAGYNADAPKVILDAWGVPIRYYRVNHPAGNPSGRYPAGYVPPGHEGTSPDYTPDWTWTPSLSEYIALRPYDIAPSDAVTWTFLDDDEGHWGDFSEVGSGSAGDPFGDPTSTGALNMGTFAYLSTGADRRLFPWARVDEPGDADGRKQWLGDHGDRGMLGWMDDGHAVLLAEAMHPTQDSESTNADNIVEIGR